MDANQVVQRAWELRVNLVRFALSLVHQEADAEDAVSIAMLKAYQRADSLREAEKVNAWLMQITARCCYDLLKKRKREIVMEAPDLRGPQVLDAPEGGLWETVSSLPEGQRQVMTLYYYEGFQAKEIGQILGIPTGTVLVRLSRGREKLKRMMLSERAVYHG